MKNSVLLMIVGVLAIVLGIVALVYPFAASITATLFVAWSFVIMGLLQVFAAFRAETTGAKIVGSLLGLIATVIGVHIIGEPLKGLLSLTLIAGILFLVSGAFKLGFGLLNFQGSARLALVLSGVISVALGLMVLNNFPQSATVLLGVLLAIELLSNGVSALALGLAVRKIDSENPA
ncbi:HdeD family acid-resistance protein [Shimia sp. MMG029]|uniref:HdeD family acid-resistance protein n=1 Tax=Shimia sp. MMG029 TaxID=3021978 RepID=UPI0022FDB5EA|nr:DUF308 domain-containing protein [Shimia sp. MMG029]MDA5558404.1 DUF308 domain-containing protein [Shimia sp. MMG029]